MVQTRYGGSGGPGGMVSGIVMVVAGIALTAMSRTMAPPGAVYVVFVGLIFAGIWRIAAAAMAPRPEARRTGARRPASEPDTGYYALPSEAPEGVCWQCGARLRRHGSLCYACGATRPRLLAMRPAPTPNAPPARSRPASSGAWPHPAGERRSGAPLYVPSGRRMAGEKTGAARDGRRPFGSPLPPPSELPREMRPRRRPPAR